MFYLFIHYQYPLMSDDRIYNMYIQYSDMTRRR